MKSGRWIFEVTLCIKKSHQPYHETVNILHALSFLSQVYQNLLKALAQIEKKMYGGEIKIIQKKKVLS